VPGSANGVLAMRLASFGNEMLKAASQAANLRRAKRGIAVCPGGMPAVKVNSLPKRYDAERSEAL